MPVSVVMPQLGESVTEGTVTRWLKDVGDTVEADEPLLEVSTDKVDTEIPAPASGVLLEILVAEDETVLVGATLATLGDALDSTTVAPVTAAPSPPATPMPSPPAIPASAPSPPPSPMPALAADSGTGGASYTTPIVRKFARDNGVDLAGVIGTGVGGRIRKEDAIAAAGQIAAAGHIAAAGRTAPAPPDAQRGRTEPLSRLRRVIAARMVESLHVSAQLTTVIEADVTAIATLRARAKDTFLTRQGVPLSFLPFFAYATIEALKEFPTVNASIDTAAGTVTYHNTQHLGIAVETERGLLVPVVRDAGEESLTGLTRRIADLADRTRTGKVGPDELSGGTFTLTNTGSRGALFDTPIINQPQVAILGTGAIVKRVVVHTAADGQDVLAIRSMVYLALTYDHRLVDGADAARFLGAVKARLEAADFASELVL